MNKELHLPVVCTRGMYVFPKNQIYLEVGRPLSLEAITESQTNFEDHIFVVSQIDPLVDVPQTDDLFEFGTLCKIKKVKKREDGSCRILVEGLERAKAVEISEEEKCFFANIEIVGDVQGDQNREVALVRQVAKGIDALATMVPNIPQELINEISKGVSAVTLVDTIAQFFPISLENKQLLLETLDVNARLELILNEIEAEKTVSSIETEINEKIQSRINDNQKEYYLRERLRAIKEELGDTPNKEDDTDNIRKTIQENPFPEAIKAKVLDELKKYDMMPQASQEANVVRSYLDLIMSLPWYQKTEDNEDLNVVEARLNEDHFGLEKVKERIIEYLAVKQMTDSLKAPIICLVGPPGVGKTSLARSIARSIDREFVKMSLGGVKDESEIRGHRRTYLGSMPGRIIQGMKKAGVVNPVFLLDELDKMASDFRGDPASAMLEVLDPEQNKYFSDHYLEESYDLSNVLFIATANYLENIPSALRDRLEIIQLSSYTQEEKINIAKNHLIKKQALEHGLKPSQLKIKDEVLVYMIQNYTQEAGVRQLERLVAKLARKVVVTQLKDNSKVSLTKTKVTEYLGKPIFDFSKKEKKNEVGVVTGLAYTPFGGDILPVEVNYFKGKGRLVITGQLGDVMKESASIALDFIKANAKKYHIDPNIFEENDIHIHVPEGATPKDGPSAGVTITTSLISALTNTKVSKEIGMTGEITLRGNVLPIGGLKEKSIAAHRSGLKTIIVPKQNEKDLDEIPKSVQAELTILFEDHIDKYLSHALLHEDK